MFRFFYLETASKLVALRLSRQRGRPFAEEAWVRRMARRFGRVRHDLLADGVSCGRHRIERLIRQAALRARPRRRRDTGIRSSNAVAPNVLDRTFTAASANRKWVADFTNLWTAEGWLYVAAAVDLFSRRVVGWSMHATMTAKLAPMHS
jgi:transposase InsO family protein